MKIITYYLKAKKNKQTILPERKRQNYYYLQMLCLQKLRTFWEKERKKAVTEVLLYSMFAFTWNFFLP